MALGGRYSMGAGGRAFLGRRRMVWILPAEMKVAADPWPIDDRSSIVIALHLRGPRKRLQSYHPVLDPISRIQPTRA